MKTLYLLRHAKSSWRDPGLSDRQRPLNKRGKTAAGFMGRYMAEHLDPPDVVYCSTARRTRDTLERVLKYFGINGPVHLTDDLYMASPMEMLHILHKVKDQCDTVMLISHNPGLEFFAEGLAGDGDADAIERMRWKYPTAALAVLQADIPVWSDLEGGGARLERFVCPKDIGSP